MPKDKVVISGSKTFKQQEKINNVYCSSPQYGWRFVSNGRFGGGYWQYIQVGCNSYSMKTENSNYAIDTGYIEDKEGYNNIGQFKNLPNLDGLLQHNDSTIHSAAYDKFKTMFTRKFNEIVNTIKSYDKNSGFKVQSLPVYNKYKSIFGMDSKNKITKTLYDTGHKSCTSNWYGWNYCWWTNGQSASSIFSTNLYYEKEE